MPRDHIRTLHQRRMGSKLIWFHRLVHFTKIGIWISNHIQNFIWDNHSSVPSVVAWLNRSWIKAWAINYSILFCADVISFCEARRASHCHSPQTTFSSNSTCCVLSVQKSAMHLVVYADRLTTQHSIVDIVHWSWSYWQFWYPRWHVECFWPALAAHWISSASHTSVLPQHPRRKIVPCRVGWNHYTSDYHG